MYKICVYIPMDHAEKVKAALFEAGAGHLEHYEHVCFEAEGTGQLRPLTGSSPFIGTEGKLERVRELKVEMICPEESIHDAIKAMKEAHPYEEPAYDVIKLEDF